MKRNNLVQARLGQCYLCLLNGPLVQGWRSCNHNLVCSSLLIYDATIVSICFQNADIRILSATKRARPSSPYDTRDNLPQDIISSTILPPGLCMLETRQPKADSRMHEDGATVDEGEMPKAYFRRFIVTVPTSDFRTHPRTVLGSHHFVSNGIIHQDLINVPFYGPVYDTAIIAHPLTISDCTADRRTGLGHVMIVLSLLKDIQKHAGNDKQPGDPELRARRDTIQVLTSYRRNALERYRRSCSPVKSEPSTPETSPGSSPEAIKHERIPAGFRSGHRRRLSIP